jgi:CRISPR-associated endonuclease/helicase Cas3
MSDPSTARLLRCWGKTGEASTLFHPVLYHMIDVGMIARELLGNSATPRYGLLLAAALGADAAELSRWLPWLVALHDIGKISAAFQMSNDTQKERLLEEGFSFRGWRSSTCASHSIIGQAHLLSENPAQWAGITPIMERVWEEMVGGHHGQFHTPDAVKSTGRSLRLEEPLEWAEMRQDVAQILRQTLDAGTPGTETSSPNISTAIAALTGFAILCDWLGSDSEHFPLCPYLSLVDYLEHSASRARQAAEQAGFFRTSTGLAPTAFTALFPDLKPPRPLQLAIDSIPDQVLASPCLAVIEAPTGEGKTEAALALAHRLAAATGTDEMYYALPTTATSNQMFGRLQKHVRDRLGLPAGVKLVHGQAFLVEDDLRLEPQSGTDGVTKDAMREWFAPRKRSLLAPFGTGTIDQAELAVLNVRHSALRLLGLAGKVVIVDEVHAYDTYMTTIIERLLAWISKLGTPVILLSATLPLAKRNALFRAYGVEPPAAREGTAYPSLWVGGTGGVHATSPPAYQPERRLELGFLHIAVDDPKDKARWLVDAVARGGCACWITNTVDRAQRLFRAVSEMALPCTDLALLHGRFPLDDRQRLEEHITTKYGPDGQRPFQGIVIGTQVLEQSLDLDFDVMVSDLAPVDLLLQRAGRLHRHRHHDAGRLLTHDSPRLWINAELDDSEQFRAGVDRFIYTEYILHRTWEVIRHKESIFLPADYRPLIEAVYDERKPEPGDRLLKAWQELQKRTAAAKGAAQIRLLPVPHSRDPYSSDAARMTFDENESSAAWIVAQTRLGEETLTVIPLERDGGLARINTVDDDPPIPVDRPAERNMQLRLLRRSLRLTHREAVAALKGQAREHPILFTQSALLKDCHPIWMRDGRTELTTTRGILVLILDQVLGMIIEKGGQ